MPHLKEMVEEWICQKRDMKKYLVPTPYTFKRKKKGSKNQYWPPETPKLPTWQKYTSTPNLWPQLTTEDTWSYLLPPKLLSLTHEQARVTESKWTFQWDTGIGTIQKAQVASETRICRMPTKTERKHKPNIDEHEENHLDIILKREKRELLARKWR